MEKIQILAMVGGISRDSINKKLFKAVKDLAPKHLVFDTCDLSKIPFFSQDLEIDPPDTVIVFKDKIREAKAVLFVTPEYNHSVPGVLKNAIDWGSRPYGQNLWDAKPAGVMGASIGKTGTYGAQMHLRQTLAYLNMRVMGQPEFYFTDNKSFNEKGILQDERSIKFIQKYLVAFESWIYEMSPLVFQSDKDDKNEGTYAH